jgi:sortase A
VLRWLAISHTHGIRPSCHASPTAGSSSNRWRWIERLAWATGVVCVGVWALAMATGAAGARKETARFAAARELRAETAPPDFKGWSKKRMLAWQATLRSPDPVPLAVLRIPRIVLEVAVLEGTGDWTLNRAVGHIEDTAVPGTAGNVGIAGHRDGFFRGLENITAGDRIDLETLEGVRAYSVERTWVVDPTEVSVLDPTSETAITLVTCFPFEWVGPAPRRFIVRATLDKTAESQ